MNTTSFSKEIIDIYKEFFFNPLDFQIEHTKQNTISFILKNQQKPFISIPKEFDKTIMLNNDIAKIRILFLLGKVFAHSLAYAIDKKKLPTYNEYLFDCWSDYYGAIISMNILMTKRFCVLIEHDYGNSRQEDLRLVHTVLEELYDKNFQYDTTYSESHKRLVNTYGGITGYVVRMYELETEKKLSNNERLELLQNIFSPYYDENSRLVESMKKMECQQENEAQSLYEFYHAINTMILINNIKNYLIPEQFIVSTIGDNYSKEVLDKFTEKKNIMHMQAGDILLVRGVRPLSKILTKVQKVTYWRTRSSHILIVVADGIFIDATLNNGVKFKFFPKELFEIHNDWRMIRKKGITREQLEELQKAVIYYYGQKYNPKYLLKNKDKSFCSELAGKIYKKAGITIFNNKAPQYIKPSDFDKAADKQIDWIDITKEAWNDVLLINKNFQIYKFAFESFSMIIEQSKQSKHYLNKMMKIGYKNGIFKEELYDY